MGDHWHLFNENDPDASVIELGDATINDEEQRATDPLPLLLVNKTSFDVRDVIVSAQGAGAQFVQFARDESGQPGVWTQPGMEVRAHDGIICRGEHFRVWTRAITTEESEVGELAFGIKVMGTAVR